MELERRGWIIPDLYLCAHVTYLSSCFLTLVSLRVTSMYVVQHLLTREVALSLSTVVQGEVASSWLTLGSNFMNPASTYNTVSLALRARLHI